MIIEVKFKQNKYHKPKGLVWEHFLVVPLSGTPSFSVNHYHQISELSLKIVI